MASPHKPIDYAIGMLKKYLVFQSSVHKLYEDDICHFILACVILHKIEIDAENVGETEEEDGIEHEDGTEVVTAETIAGRKQRNALFYYVLPNKD